MADGGESASGTNHRTVIAITAIVAVAAVAIAAIVVLGNKSQNAAGPLKPTTASMLSSKCNTTPLFALVQQHAKSVAPTAVAPVSGSVTAYCAGGWAVLQNFSVQAGSGYGLAVFKRGPTGWNFVMIGDTSESGAGYVPCSQYPAPALLALGDHLCTAASPTTSATSAPTTTPPALPVVVTCANGSPGGIKPTTLYYGCATGDDSVTGITWSSWGATSALGTATYNVNQCDPDCAAGNDTSVSATITLTDPAPTEGVLVFQNLSISTANGTLSVSLSEGAGTWGSA